MCREKYQLKRLDLFSLLKILRRCFLNLHATIFTVILLIFELHYHIQTSVISWICHAWPRFHEIERIKKYSWSKQKIDLNKTWAFSLFQWFPVPALWNKLSFQNIILNLWFMSSDLNLRDVDFTSYAEFKEYIDIWFLIILILQSLSTLLPHPFSS